MSALGIQLEAVVKTFRTDAGDVRAVRGISLEVEPGSSLAITGPSGCGKSTLLAMIGALEPPSSGRLAVGDQVISEMGEDDRARFRREQFGFVFQDDNLQPHLSATENVSLQLALTGHQEQSERAVQLLAGLGLAREAERFPDELSGGERQRVAVARALVHRPRLILADEPTGSLDRDNSMAVVDLLIEAQATAGATLVVITHDPAVAARMERQVQLSDGELADDSRSHGAQRRDERKRSLRV